jgi:two-component system, NtrC family, sensor kinase
MHSSAPIIASSPADLASADQALLQRPRVSIRLRVVLLVLVTIALTGAMTLAAMIFIAQLGAKQLFIEKAANYAFDIQQARRFEKNFLLYGTSLPDALADVAMAGQVLTAAREDFCATLGTAAYARMAAGLSRYRVLLERLDTLSGQSDGGAAGRREAVQAELRRVGAALVTDAAGAIEKERLRFHHGLHSARIVILAGMILITVFAIYTIVFIIQRIFLPFRRFESYMRRIAAGDFSPVTPAKTFQDEFTDLAVAVNRMIGEIQDRGNQLSESRKMAAIGTLTAGIAHEINNPLNNISLTADALIDDFDTLSDPEKIGMLSEMSAQVERAGATIANLLDFAQRDQRAFEALDIRDVLSSTVAILSKELKLDNITVNTVAAEDLPQVIGHRQNLQQVFLNLLLNAREAMPEGGRLSIEINHQDEVVRIAIRDTGEGIPESLRNRIFDPFFTTKAVGKGTGLGLSVSFGIIEKHHGTIAVESEVGKGSTFSVTLPAAPQ